MIKCKVFPSIRHSFHYIIIPEETDQYSLPSEVQEDMQDIDNPREMLFTESDQGGKRIDLAKARIDFKSNGFHYHRSDELWR